MTPLQQKMDAGYLVSEQSPRSRASEVAASACTCAFAAGDSSPMLSPSQSLADFSLAAVRQTN